MKIKNIISEETEWTEWKETNPAEAKKKKDEGCETKEETGGDGKKHIYYRCPKNTSSQQPEWGECIIKSFPKAKFSGDYATTLNKSERTIYKFNKNFTLEIETDTGDKYTGFWRCYGSNLKMATCEDKEVWYSRESLEWTADTENWGEKMGCPKTSSNTGGGSSSTGFKTNCGDNLKKGCKDVKIEKLQSCLNSNKKSGLFDLVVDGKWGKKTQEKLEEKFPQYKDGVTEVKITEICDTIKKENDALVTPEKPEDKKEKYTVTFGEGKLKKVKLKEDVSEEGERYSMPDKEFFNTALEYGCLPTWLNDPRIAKVKDSKGVERNAIYGDSINNPANKYAFFRDFSALNLTTGKQSTWACKDLVDYINRPKTCGILTKFGVDCKLGGEELVRKLNAVTNNLQKFIERGAVSDDIMEWNKTLTKNYSKYESVIKLDFKGKSDVYTPDDPQDLELKYKEANLSQYPYQDVKIYLPKRTDKLATEGPLTGENKEMCLKYLKTYLGHSILNAAGVEPQSMPKLEMYRSSVINCSNSGQYKGLVLKKDEVLDPNYYGGLTRHPFDKYRKEFEWRDVVKFLKGEVSSKQYDGKTLKLPSPYAVTLQESLLKTKIKSSLNEMVLDKRKQVIQEGLLKKRVEVIFENTKFKTRQQRREFVISLLKEAFLIESQGFDKKLINEEFWDVVKGFFGKEGSESVFTSFKSRMGEWLTSHLSPKKSNGWIGECIKKTIQDIDMRDVHKISDCEFLTKKISSSIIQKLKEKMSNEELKDNGLYDIVRGGMSDNVDSERFKDHIESKVSDMICPILRDMSNRFDSTFDEMKKRAVGLN